MYAKGAQLTPDTMDTWDDAKLQDVVNQNAKKQRNTTDVGGVSGFGLTADRVQVLYPGDRGQQVWVVVSTLEFVRDVLTL